MTEQKTSAHSDDIHHAPVLYLAFAQEDAGDLAQRLTIDLGARGYKIAGERGADNEAALRGADLMIPVLSPGSVRRPSGTALDEIAWWRSERDAPIVPIMAVACQPPLLLARLDHVDFTGWRESERVYQKGLQRLIDAIQSSIRGRVRFNIQREFVSEIDFTTFLANKRQGFSGREWLFGVIESWLRGDEGSVLLLSGLPGTGKTAVAAELVHRNPNDAIIAYHCCIAGEPSTRDPALFVASVAAMMARRLPDYGALLDEPQVRDALSDAARNADPVAAFEAGVIDPLRSLPPPKGGTRALLIDALDEALIAKDTSAPTILDLLDKRFPEWLRLLVTSRIDPEVFKRLRDPRIVDLNADDTRRHRDLDLEDYALGRLAEPALRARLTASGTSNEEAMRWLVNRSGGNFLVLRLALESIAKGESDFADLDAAPTGLANCYRISLDRMLPEGNERELCLKVLETFAAATGPLSQDQLTSATLADRWDLANSLGLLSRFLVEREDGFAIFHESLRDWLTGDAGPYTVNPRAGSARLADMCAREREQAGREMSTYAVKHLATYLFRAERWDDLDRLLTDFWFLRCYLDRVEVNLATGLSGESWHAHEGFFDIQDLLYSRLAAPFDSEESKLRIEALAKVWGAHEMDLLKHPGSMAPTLYSELSTLDPKRPKQTYDRKNRRVVLRGGPFWTWCEAQRERYEADPETWGSAAVEGSLIFICANSSDYEQAEQVYQFLVDRGHDTFFAPRSIPHAADADYRRRIDDALERAQHMVVVTSSRENAESDWVEGEWGTFVNEKRSGRKSGNLVTMTVARLLPEALPLSLRNNQVLPFEGESMDTLLPFLQA